MEKKFGYFGELGNYEATPSASLAQEIYKNLLEIVKANDQDSAKASLEMVYGMTVGAVKEVRVKESVTKKQFK